MGVVVRLRAGAYESIGVVVGKGAEGRVIDCSDRAAQLRLARSSGLRLYSPLRQGFSDDDEVMPIHTRFL